MLAKRFFTICILFTMFFGTSALAQGSGRIAVYVTGGEAEVNKAFAINMSHALDRTGRFPAIERHEAFLDAVVADSAVGTSDSLIIDRAKQAGAEYVCFISLNFALGSYLISARIVDAETGGTTVSGITESPLQTLSDLRLAVVNIIRAFRGLQSPAPTPPAVAHPQPAVTPDEPEPEPELELVLSPAPQQPEPMPIAPPPRGIEDVMADGRERFAETPPPPPGDSGTTNRSRR